jgi:hypothetical protein
MFVQIPAYRDSELAATLLDLYAKARCPEFLRVVVLWQHAAQGENTFGDLLAARVCRMYESSYREHAALSGAVRNRPRGQARRVLRSSPRCRGVLEAHLQNGP